MAAKKLKPAKKKVANPRGASTVRKTASKKAPPKAEKQSLAPKRRVVNPPPPEEPESPPEPAVLPTPSATFVF